MDNQAYQHDHVASSAKDLPPSYQSTVSGSVHNRHQQQFSLVHEEMEELRAKLEPGVYNAVLNHGEMPASDLFKLMFLIGFPTFFFFLTIILMATDDSA